MPGLLNMIVPILYILLLSYRIFYIPVSLFLKKKERDCSFSYHDYGILICARNEEDVIADLLDSIQRQTYPKDHFETFVMADNCADRTALIAKEKGVNVYERHDLERIGKGYALEKLLKDIERDHGERFDAYIVVDADNIMKEDFIEQMNLNYCKGECIIAGYIASKNYDSNWISAGYSLFLLHKNRFLNNARHILGSGCAINGTGFLFDRKLIGEWNYHTLTEDIELSVDQASRGHRIGYCEKAIVYDEQPTSFRQSFLQRSRWAKGYLQVMKKYSIFLMKGIAEGDFTCWDMWNTVCSGYFLPLLSVAACLFRFLYLIGKGGNLSVFLWTLGSSLLRTYLCVFLTGILTVVCERKNIHASVFLAFLYTLTYPLFLATYLPIAVYALFAKVSWAPIRHTLSLSQTE